MTAKRPRAPITHDERRAAARKGWETRKRRADEEILVVFTPEEAATLGEAVGRVLSADFETEAERRAWDKLASAASTAFRTIAERTK